MELSDKMYKIGYVEECTVLPTSQIPFDLKNKIHTRNTLRIKYTITMPGLILDNDSLGAKIENNELIFYELNGEKLYAPDQSLKYTVVEPMRISDFMEINYKASKSLNETNEKISEILSDEMVSELKDSIKNINELTLAASTTLDKAQLLIESSKDELEEVLNQSNKLIVVRTLTSTFSPMQTITTSQFWIPASSRVSMLRSSDTNAYSVYCLISLIVLSSLSITITSLSDCASVTARAVPNRPSPITPYVAVVFLFFIIRLDSFLLYFCLSQSLYPIAMLSSE